MTFFLENVFQHLVIKFLKSISASKFMFTFSCFAKICSIFPKFGILFTKYLKKAQKLDVKLGRNCTYYGTWQKPGDQNAWLSETEKKISH